jgi:hypothetical protein
MNKEATARVGSQLNKNEILTKSLEQNPSWEANRPLVNTSPHFFNLKFHYCAQNSPPLFPGMSQINPIHALQFYFL